MSTVQRILETVQELPEAEAQEVLDFAQFLRMKQGKRPEEPATGFEPFIGSLAQSPHFNGDLVEWQRAQRNEWTERNPRS
jgi:hypothetical protein